jgi:CO/xanthine dehydrogenase FAD-binding subunit
MLPEFSIVRPGNKEQVLEALNSFPDAAVLAGGTDILVRMKRGGNHSKVIDITSLADLKGVSPEDGFLRIGPTTTHCQINRSSLVALGAPGLASACGSVGSPQIRNMGTIGGNIVNASPAADTIPPLLIHDAVVTLESKAGVRKIEFEKFISGPYRTIIRKDEIVTSINLVPLNGHVEGYRRVAKRATLAISRLSVAWAIMEQDGIFTDVRLAIGSCTPMPLRPRQTENFLRGKARERDVVSQAVAMTIDEIRRMSGERPSFAYKLPVVRDLITGILGGVSCS